MSDENKLDPNAPQDPSSPDEQATPEDDAAGAALPFEPPPPPPGLGGLDFGASDQEPPAGPAEASNGARDDIPPPPGFGEPDLGSGSADVPPPPDFASGGSDTDAGVSAGATDDDVPPPVVEDVPPPPDLSGSDLGGAAKPSGNKPPVAVKKPARRGINLRERLGRRTVDTAAGPSIPPPIAIPRPPGMGAGSGPPPPGAAPAAPPPKAQELVVDETEVKQAVARGRMLAGIAGGVALLLGGVLGYVTGTSLSKNTRQTKAISDAAAIEEAVKKASGKIDDLDATLNEAAEAAGLGKFPEAQIQKLGELDIPFGPEQLMQRDITLFKKVTQATLLDFTRKVAEANELREGLQNVLLSQKKAVEEELEDRQTPKVNLVIMMDQTPDKAGGPEWANLMPLPESFPIYAPDGWKPQKPEKFKNDREEKEWEEKNAKGEIKYEWPKEIEFKNPQDKTDVKKFARYSEPKDLRGSTPALIPVNPGSFKGVCPDKSVFTEMKRDIAKLKYLIEPPSGPGSDARGLKTMAKELGDQLGRLAEAGE